MRLRSWSDIFRCVGTRCCGCPIYRTTIRQYSCWGTSYRGVIVGWILCKVLLSRKKEKKNTKHECIQDVLLNFRCHHLCILFEWISQPLKTNLILKKKKKVTLIAVEPRFCFAHWSQNGKASSRSLPSPARVFFWGMARGLLMAPWRSPVPLPAHPWDTRYEWLSRGMCSAQQRAGERNALKIVLGRDSGEYIELYIYSQQVNGCRSLNFIVWMWCLIYILCFPAGRC